MTSIRRRTLGLVLLVFGISMLIIGYISYRYAAREIEALHDRSLAQNAVLLEGLLQVPLPEYEQSLLISSLEKALSAPHQRVTSATADTLRELAFQLWEEDRLLLRSASGPSTPLAQQPAGYSTITVDEYEWRVYVLDIPNSPKRVVVSEREASLQQGLML